MCTVSTNTIDNLTNRNTKPKHFMICVTQSKTRVSIQEDFGVQKKKEFNPFSWAKESG